MTWAWGDVFHGEFDFMPNFMPNFMPIHPPEPVYPKQLPMLPGMTIQSRMYNFRVSVWQVIPFIRMLVTNPHFSHHLASRSRLLRRPHPPGALPSRSPTEDPRELRGSVWVTTRPILARRCHRRSIRGPQRRAPLRQSIDATASTRPCLGLTPLLISLGAFH